MTLGKGKGEFEIEKWVNRENHFLFSISQFLILVLLVGLGACSPFLSEEPPLSDSTMVEVLIEMHLARARHELQQDLPSSVQIEILDEYGLTESQFREAMAFYVDHPEAYNTLYASLMDRLAAERPSPALSAKEEMKLRMDSTTAINR